MNIAVILIGGSGQRFGSDIPKQFAKVNGKDMFIYTTEVFQANENIDEILLVYPKGWKEYVKDKCDSFSLSKVLHYVEGGSTRQESGHNAVKYLLEKGFTDAMILEHDGDRVLIEDKIINDCIACCEENGNAWPGINSTDYIVEGSPREIVGNLKTRIKRDTFRTHTPCVFYLDALKEIYSYCDKNNISNMCTACDIALDMGIKVYPVQSTTKNGIKLVTQEDYDIIKLILENNERKSQRSRGKVIGPLRIYGKRPKVVV